MLYENSTESITDNDTKLTEKENQTENELMSKYEFVHLRDTQYFSDGRFPVPSDGGVYTRIKIENISGFNFGKLTKKNVE